MNILVIGGNGGIGQAIVAALTQRSVPTKVFATYNRHVPQTTNDEVTWYRLDVSQESSIAELAQRFDHLDWIINCVGMLHTESQGPEKNLSSVDPAFFLHNVAINSLPTLLIAKHFQTVLKRSAHPCLATISAKVGSISDNQLGGWYSYRASKAALNMAIKGISIEWSRVMPQSVVVALHPGTTDTVLSKPFQTNVPAGKLFTPERVANDLLKVLGSLTHEDTGQFITYDGERLAW